MGSNGKRTGGYREIERIGSRIVRPFTALRGDDDASHLSAVHGRPRHAPRVRITGKQMRATGVTRHVAATAVAFALVVRHGVEAAALVHPHERVLVVTRPVGRGDYRPPRPLHVRRVIPVRRVS